MPYVSGNKTFKANCIVKYDGWLATERITNKTEEGNLKALPRKKIIKWILDACVALPSEIIKEPFIHCALSLSTDGSYDDLIHCFKKGQSCFQGREALLWQLMTMQDEENPFKNSSESDDEEA